MVDEHSGHTGNEQVPKIQKSTSIAQYVHEWRKITSDPKVINMVQGIRLEFEDILPVQTSVPRPIKFSDKDSELIDLEIASFLKRGIISMCDHVEGEVISNIFFRPKRSGGIRIILDVSWLNTFLKFEHFKCETIYSTTELISNAAYMASVDLSDAYFSCLIHPGHRKYLRFLWRNQLLEFCRLAQGLSPAPRFFTLLTKCPLAALRKQGHIVSGYIDDLLLVGQTFDQCLSCITDTCNLFTKLGFIINRNKSVLTPVTLIEHLGFCFDSRSMTMTLIQKRKQDIIDCIQKVTTTSSSVRIRDVCRLIGLFVAAEPGVQYAFLHYRHLEREKSQALRERKGNYNAKMSLSRRALSDIQWWNDNISSISKPLTFPDPSVHLYSDSSLTGWGAWITDGSAHSRSLLQTHGSWSAEQQQLHINVLELTAALYGLQSLCGKDRNCHIQIHTDNTTAVTYINNFGGIRSWLCDSVAKQIWDWAITRHIWVSAVFIPGNQNTRADKLSRHTDNMRDWTLDQEVFDRIFLHVDWASVDLFASANNAKISKFVSWQPEALAWRIDAFSIVWDFEFYAFPPFSMIGRVLRKIERDQAKGILIAPCWPTQVWFPKLLWLLYKPPIKLPNSAHLLHHPNHKGPHPLVKKMRLTAWPLSGVPSMTETFRRELKTLSSVHGGTPQNPFTLHTSASGSDTVVNGAEIPFVKM